MTPTGDDAGPAPRVQPGPTIGQNRGVPPLDARRHAGWLALPVFVIVLALIGMGTSTEGSRQFADQQDRSTSSGADRDPQARGDRNPFDDPSPARTPADPDPATGEAEGNQITIVTEEGEIVVTTDGERVWLRPVDRDEVAQLDPDDLVAIRLTEDGGFEVVPIEEIEPGDTVVTPAENGFDLTRPDGTVVEFRADGRNGGVTATEIDPDGRSTELTPNEDGSVTLGDGTTVGPIDTADPGTFGRILERTRGLPWRWILLGLGLLALVSVALAVHLHRKRPGDAFDLDQLARSDVPDDRFERFLAGLAADPDPARAVRIGFSVVERGLGGVPPRRDDETPFEWHRRVEADRPGFGPVIGAVCDLFARVRFAPGQATEEDRRTMVESLRRLHHVDRGSGGPAGPAGPGGRAEPVEV